MRHVNKAGDRPAYKQLADIIREAIISGELPANSELPSEAALAAEHGISKTSVTQALGVLRSEGMIVSARGKLTRVRPVRVIGSQRYSIGKQNYGDDRDSAFAREHGVPWSDFDVTREYRIVPASPRVAAALKLTPGAEVFERRFTHATGGVLLRMSHSYLSAARFADTILTDPDEPLWPGGTIGQMYALGINVSRVRSEVTARPATADEAQTLGLAAGSPVLEVWRTQLADDEPVETAQHVYPPGGQLLVFDIPVGPPSEGNKWKDVSYD
jgi:GntR family transcriptional regulator